MVGRLVRFFKRCAVPLEDWLRPLFFVGGDGNHSGNRRGGLGQAASWQLDLVRAGGSAETHDPSCSRAHADEWFSEPGRAVESAGRSDVIGRL